MFTSAGGFGSGAAQTINAAAGDIIITGAYPGTSTNVTVNNGGGRLTIDGSFNTTIGTTGRGDIAGTNGLTKNGSGTLTLGGTLPNIYTGVTVINSGTVTANKVNALGTGALTMNGGILNIGANAQTVGAVTNAGGTMNGNATLTGTFYNMVSGVVNLNLGGVGVALTKTGAGTLELNGANTYTGPTRIEGGILRLGAADRIADSSNLQLAGGILDTGGFSEMLGTLDLDLDSMIDFGAGASALVFADSDALDWGGALLTIVNWTPGVDSIRIGTDGVGFDTQLALFRFADFGNAPGQIDANGFVTPAVPEPSTLALALLGGLAFWGFFRRRR
jgi:autotransporter-associated beta strand protein